MDRLNILWQKYLRNELSREETRQLLKAMEKEANRLLFSRLMEKEWDAAEKENITSSDHKLMQKIRIELGMKQNRPSVRRRLFLYTSAACFILLFGLGVWWIAPQFFGGRDFIRVEVAAGQPAEAFTLPDNSVVWLNSATVLEYRKNFKEGRDIKLEGEAYFEVSPDRTHPFRVNFRDNELLVTGTRFVVKAYTNEELSRVDVEEGSVKVYHDSDSTALQRNNSLVIDEYDNTATFSRSDFTGANSWKDGLLSFNNIPLDETLNALERYFNVYIDTDALSGTTVKKHITAAYPLGTSLKEVMEGLQHLLDIHYEFKDSGTLKVYESPETKLP
ncbi:FecR family protein [Sinomicrobium sp. M5D2P17]